MNILCSYRNSRLHKQLVSVILLVFFLVSSSLHAQQEELQESTWLLAKACFQADTTNITCLSDLADGYFLRGEHAQAKLLYHKLIVKDTIKYKPYINLAAIYELQQNIPKATKYYSIVNKLLPDNGIYFRKNAQLFKQFGDFTNAFSLYNKALKLNPNDLLTVKGLAEIFLANDQTTESDSMLTYGLTIDDTNIGLLLLKAKCKYKLKDYGSVVEILEKTVGQIDLDSYYNKLLGYAYLQVDSVDLAISKLQLALVDDDNSDKLYYYLASAFEKKGEKDAALNYYQEAVKAGISPDLDLYHRNSARIANELKDYPLALKHYKEAYRLSNDPTILYYIGALSDLYYKDKSIAINYYTQYLKYETSDTEKINYTRERVKYLKEITHQNTK